MLDRIAGFVDSETRTVAAATTLLLAERVPSRRRSAEPLGQAEFESEEECEGGSRPKVRREAPLERDPNRDGAGRLGSMEAEIFEQRTRRRVLEHRRGVERKIRLPREKDKEEHRREHEGALGKSWTKHVAQHHVPCTSGERPNLGQRPVFGRTNAAARTRPGSGSQGTEVGMRSRLAYARRRRTRSSPSANTASHAAPLSAGTDEHPPDSARGAPGASDASA